LLPTPRLDGASPPPHFTVPQFRARQGMIDGRSCFGFAYLGALDDIEEAGVNLGADGQGPSDQLLTINHS
jgi:hypothetical protein